MLLQSAQQIHCLIANHPQLHRAGICLLLDSLLHIPRILCECCNVGMYSCLLQLTDLWGQCRTASDPLICDVDVQDQQQASERLYEC